MRHWTDSVFVRRLSCYVVSIYRYMYLFQNVAERDGDCHREPGEILDDGLGECLDAGEAKPKRVGNIWFVMKKMDWPCAMKYCKSEQAEIPKDLSKATVLNALSSMGSGLCRRRLVSCAVEERDFHIDRGSSTPLWQFEQANDTLAN